MVKLTVIMPSLNVKKYIAECMESVLNQTLKEIEVLCIDAGSVDGTIEILRDYQRKDSRVKIINSEKKSYGYQVNLGIKEATGKYIAILETDDFIDIKMYETLYDIAEKEKNDFVKCDFIKTCINDIGEYDYVNVSAQELVPNLYNRVINSTEMNQMYNLDVNVWRGIYRKSFLEKFRITFNESNGAAFQDIGFLMQVLSYAKSAIYVNQAFYYYRTDRVESSTYNSKSFQYALQEVDWLEQNIIPRMESIEKIRCIYKRLLAIFIYQCGNITLINENVVAESIINTFVEYANKIREWWQKKLLVQEDFEDNKYLWNCMKRIIFDGKSIIWEEIGEKKIIIFGCGNIGKSVVLNCILHGRNVVACIDNNKEYCGKKVINIPVLSFNEIQNWNSDIVYVIANKANNVEMKKQLLNRNMSESNIFVYEDIE